jgi:hypothetical protein
MSTTDLFIELVFVGVGSMIWILSFIFVCCDPLIFDYARAFIQESSTLFSLLVVGASYVAGIIFDRAYVLIWKEREKIIQGKYGIQSLDDYYQFQMDSGKNNHEIYRVQLNFYTSRMRILRGSMINFFILGVIIFMYSYKLAILCFMCHLVATYSWLNLTDKYYKKIAPVINKNSKLFKLDYQERSLERCA